MSMRRVACLAAALGAAAVLAPDVAAARGWHGGHGGYGFGFYGGPAFYGPRPYFGYYGGYYLPPPVVYAPPPPVYYAPPIVSYPQPTYIVPPAGYTPQQLQQQQPGYVPQQQNLAPGVSQKFSGRDGGLKK